MLHKCREGVCPLAGGCCADADQYHSTSSNQSCQGQGKGKERKALGLGGRGSLIDNFEIEIIGFDALGCLLLLDVVQPAELLELSEGGKGEESAVFWGGEGAWLRILKLR